jgi:putative ABC transport system permease protein
VPDLRTALTAEGSFDASQITEVGRVTRMQGGQEARVSGTESWESYPVLAGDDAFFAVNEAKLEGRAVGYSSDRDVFEAVRTRPNLAIIDNSPLAAQQDMGGGSDFRVKDTEITGGIFQPFELEVRDAATGQTATLTVIGVFTGKAPMSVLQGIYTSDATYANVYGQPAYERFLIRTASGVDTEAAAKGIKAALLTPGVQAVSIQEEIDTMMAQNRAFTRMFQGFMALGLFVGIAALGVIAFRSVVERRQQIGMLRALGFQQGTVSLAFILEASFVAMMGILSGIVGAAILSRNLLNSDDFTEGATGIQFSIPWGEVGAFVVAAYLFALLMTWWPSRGASRVPVAEALRYE